MNGATKAGADAAFKPVQRIAMAERGIGRNREFINAFAIQLTFIRVATDNDIIVAAN